MSKEDSLDLGFLSTSEPSSPLDVFSSKVGGKPNWLVPKDLPDLTCPSCHMADELCLLTQLYAPIDHLHHAFHRVLYLFMCRRPQCHSSKEAPFVGVRGQLNRSNPYYPFTLSDSCTLEPLEMSVCEVCGLKGDKKCGQCGLTQYCGRAHQKLHWPLHKALCSQKEGASTTKSGLINSKRKLKYLLPEQEVSIEPAEPEDYPQYYDTKDDGDADEDDNEEDHDESLFNQLQSNSHFSSSSLSKFAKSGRGLVRFKETIRHSPEQIIRYERRGQPLWMDDDENEDDGSVQLTQTASRVRKCEYCGSERVFECQIMPQLLALIDMGVEIDFGVIALFTCDQSCTQGQDVYKSEVIVHQKLSNKDSEEGDGDKQE